MKKIFLLIVLSSPAAFGWPFSESLLRSNGCNDILHLFCRDLTDKCEAVYIASSKSSQKCKSLNSKNMENTCGDKNAKLYNTGKECILAHTKLNPNKSPKTIQALKKSDIEKIYSYVDLHKDICREACGARYDLIDIRNFFQTERKPGLACSDQNLNKIKNGINLKDDPQRKSCTEIHSGVFRWCINYNKVLNGIDFGPYIQCAGRL